MEMDCWNGMDSWYEVEVWPKIEKVGADGSLWWATRWQRGGLVAAGATRREAATRPLRQSKSHQASCNLQSGRVERQQTTAWCGRGALHRGRCSAAAADASFNDNCSAACSLQCCCM